MIIELNLNLNTLQLRQHNNSLQIWDKIRKKWYLKTPEETVRQAIINYLIEVKKYPSTVIGIEKKIIVGQVTKRFDIVVYNSNIEPWMLIECKAPKIFVDEQTFGQVGFYNLSIKAAFIVMSNGITTYCLNTLTKEWLKELPNFNQ